MANDKGHRMRYRRAFEENDDLRSELAAQIAAAHRLAGAADYLIGQMRAAWAGRPVADIDEAERVYLETRRAWIKETNGGGNG